MKQSLVRYSRLGYGWVAGPGRCWFCLAALVLPWVASCTTAAQKGMMAGTDMRQLVPFAGLGKSPAGSGVDLCLHSGRVRKNPTSNPNLAWDGSKAFTIMAHGIASDLGPVLIDETGVEERKLTPEQLIRRIKADGDLRNRFDASDTIVLYACGSGSQTPGGFPSFASRLARLTGKPVVAPSAKLYMNRGIGAVASGGVFRVEVPEAKSFVTL